MGIFENLNSLTTKGSARWGSGVWWRRVFHTQTEIFPSILALPVHRYILTEWMNKGNSSCPGTLFNTTTAEPALFRIKNDGCFFLQRIRHHHIGWTNFYTKVASVAFSWIEFYSFIGCWGIGNHIKFFAHCSLPPEISISTYVLQLKVYNEVDNFFRNQKHRVAQGESLTVAPGP